MLIGFAAIAVILGVWHGWGKPLPEATRLPGILLGIGIIGFILTLIPGKIALPFYWLWFAVSACIGIVISNALLIVFYYLVFTPIVLLVRAGGRDPLRLKQPDGNTMWQEHPRNIDKKRYFRQY